MLFLDFKPTTLLRPGRSRTCTDFLKGNIDRDKNTAGGGGELSVKLGPIGQFTLSTQLIKPNYLLNSPLTQHHSFFRNLIFYSLGVKLLEIQCTINLRSLATVILLFLFVVFFFFLPKIF